MRNTSEHPTTMPLISTHAGREIWSDKPFYLDARDPTQLFIVICIELEANKKHRYLQHLRPKWPQVQHIAHRMGAPQETREPNNKRAKMRYAFR